VFAFASLAVLAVELKRRNDQFFVDARRAFLVELEVELGELPTQVDVIDRALGEVRFEGTRFLVLAGPTMRVQSHRASYPMSGHRAFSPSRLMHGLRTMRRGPRGQSTKTRALRSTWYVCGEMSTPSPHCENGKAFMTPCLRYGARTSW